VIEDCVADGWTGAARGPGAGISIVHDSVVRNCVVELNGIDGILISGSTTISRAITP
jgi:hypothetical protein